MVKIRFKSLYWDNVFSFLYTITRLNLNYLKISNTIKVMTNLGIITVSKLTGDLSKTGIKPNKHNVLPVAITNIAGTSISPLYDGTMAERAGLIAGKTYQVLVEETGTSDEYGANYQYKVLGEASFMDMVNAQTLPKQILKPGNKKPVISIADATEDGI